MPRDNYFEADTLDDLLQDVLKSLLELTDFIPTTRKPITELFGATLILTNPRARLSRSESKGKLFSAMGELLWYLTGENKLDFIRYYVGERYVEESEDGVSVRSGYGERLFNHNGFNQINNLIELLKRKKSSRRAVIQLFDASDLEKDYKSIPCTCTLQFVVRDEALNLLVNMRSNDAYFGLPHDIFAFTMLQEIIARTLNIDVGIYQHVAGSLHLYKHDRDRAETYLQEGWQNKIKMGAMPEGDPWTAINEVRQLEQQIRAGSIPDLTGSSLDSYWKDICRLLIIYRQYRDQEYEKCRASKADLDDPTYHMFVDGKLPT